VVSIETLLDASCFTLHWTAACYRCPGHSWGAVIAKSRSATSVQKSRRILRECQSLLARRHDETLQHTTLSSSKQHKSACYPIQLHSTTSQQHHVYTMGCISIDRHGSPDGSQDSKENLCFVSSSMMAETARASLGDCEPQNALSP